MASMFHGGSNKRNLTADEGGHKDLERAVRKVLTDIAKENSHSNSQGWPEMAKTLRDVDEEKIRDTKEDIDTLLVFAGLFAAVLTPFLAETYQTLSEDPADTSVAIQRHMSVQLSSYVMINGFLNSTVPAFPSDSPPFDPPPFALFINVLWFASLALAVVTASFGILVKQWLREYMAIETSRSVKSRLRVRQFREGGLKKWKVFEIAAVLPLLLQIALGLFFVGLCFFSWLVHPTIGGTITSIVSGWACFFFFAIIAPACSARCPYKTALFKNAMRVLRRWSCSSQITRYVYLGPVKENGTPMEDEDAAADAKGDVKILTAADAILLDDDLLVTTMSNSLEDIQSSADPVEVINFVVAALQQRSPSSNHIGSRSIHSLDLSRLPERVWTVLVKITAQTLTGGQILRQTFNHDLEEWAKDAIIVLSTYYPSTFLSGAGDALRKCMSSALIPTCELIGSAQNLLTGDTFGEPDSPGGEKHKPDRWLFEILEIFRSPLSHPKIAIRMDYVLQDISSLSASERQTGSQGIGLIIAAYIAMMDVALLRQALKEVLQRYKTMPSDCMAFILRILQNGQNHRIPLNGITRVLHFDDISRDTWTAIMDSTAQLLNDALDIRLDVTHWGWEVWMKDALLVLLSISEHPMTEEGSRILARCTSSPENRQSIIVQLLSLNFDPQHTEYESYPGVFVRPHSSSSPIMLFKLEEAVCGAADFIQNSSCDDACVHGRGLGEMFAAHRGQFLIFSRVVRFLMASAMAAKTCLQDTSSSGLDELLLAIFSADLVTLARAPIDPSTSSTSDYSYLGTVTQIRNHCAHIVTSASECTLADMHVLDPTYCSLDASGRCRLLGVIEDVLGHRKAKNFTETFSVLTLFKVAYLYLHLMHLQTAAGIVLTDYEYWRWCRILSNLVDELRHLEHLQAQQDDDPIIAVAGQCLDLLASHPAIGTFIGTLPELWYLTNYGLEDLVRALQAFIPKHKALQHPILDTLPIKEHILEFSPKTEPSVWGLGDIELEYYVPADDYPASD
ncbi:hypothetical protein PHLCEN_2v7411 [Hermanssonia centrifuga]|uniref:DUF6535 domain-containing protein n=1 Tax=Hermanssonia centrifuga TaxID=98765 RepID=A0A2R6NWP0_9APHY|nr:hypothetical protein PHLCEN_2v7411 [Hermanssonia centrifuga]